jgi:Zinc carboxypeptidase
MNRLLLISSLLLSLHIFAAIESDSGIFGPTYKKILASTEAWAAQYPDLVTLVDYGKSIEGRPLRMVIVMRPNSRPERPAFLMSGSTHGNEYLDIETKLPIRLLEKHNSGGEVQKFLDQGGAFVFVPILNPDGYEHRERENAHGVDLNRDWTVPEANFEGFSQPETKQLSDFLEKLTKAPYHFKFKVTVDYHCCAGAILYPWSFTDKKLPEPDLTHHINLAKAAQKFLSIDFGTTGDVLGYFPEGTTKDYYYSKYHSLTYTFEGRRNTENKFLEGHIKWWEAMVGDTLKAKNSR